MLDLCRFSSLIHKNGDLIHKTAANKQAPSDVHVLEKQITSWKNCLTKV